MSLAPAGGDMVLPGKVTSWMSVNDIIPYLEEGDLIEFHRDVFQHWAVFVHECEGCYYIVHLTGGNDNEFSEIGAQSVASPLKASFQVSTHGSRTGFRNARTISLSDIPAYVKTSLGDAQTAEVCCHNIFTVGRGSKCRINNSKDTDFQPYAKQEISARAISEIGRQKYNLLFTNCEHFVTWCRYGSKSSKQTTKVKSVAVGAVAAMATGSLGIGVVAGVGCLVTCHACNKLWNKVSRNFELMW